MTRLRSGSRSSFAARAKVRRGWADISIGFEGLAAKFPAAKSPTMTAAADEPSAASRCLAFSTKTRLSLAADCRLETLVTTMELSPRRWQPSFPARSRRDCFMAPYCRFLGWECTTPAPSHTQQLPSFARLGQPRAAAVPTQSGPGEAPV